MDFTLLANEVAKTNRWEVVKGDSNELFEIHPDGVVHCVDGRLQEGVEGENNKLKGPKIQGGVLGIMSLLIKRGDEQAVRDACKLLKDKGFIPSVHGDDHKQESGCGFGALWLNGKLDGFPKLEISLERVKEIVLEEGGEYVPLTGSHNENKVRVNLVKGKTIEPDESSFNLDLWFVEELGYDPMEVAANALQVVNLLKPEVKTVEIYS